jgi:uncharacterized membrane protein YfcA
MILELPITADILYLLLMTSFVASMLTASVGIGGGTLVLAVLVITVPITAVVPMHSVVQLGSNTGRTVMMRPHVSSTLFWRLLVGAVLGTLLAAPFSAFWLNEVQLTLLLAAFTLLVTWLPLPAVKTQSLKNHTVFGTGISFIGVFVSATGPLVAAYMRHQTSGKQELVATMAATISTMNLFRVFLFSGLGFFWTEWLIPLLLMIAAGFGGTLIGLQLLGRLPEQLFQALLKLLLTVLALLMIVRVV